MRDPGPSLPHSQKINVEFTGASVSDFIAFFTRLGPDFSLFWSLITKKNKRKTHLQEDLYQLSQPLCETHKAWSPSFNVYVIAKVKSDTDIIPYPSQQS